MKRKQLQQQQTNDEELSHADQYEEPEVNEDISAPDQYEEEVRQQQEDSFTDETKQQINQEMEENDGYSSTLWRCDQVLYGVQEGYISKEEAGDCLK
ncbi:hypothetical protein [Priestia megaterium]|uniref:hypothetical protein n=1 Tax=Priestia megaterium TaxID=1404 RepID=UPI000471976C|nr:hypothetical protein [Priestia megaterium]PFB03815.1 hypothetical protein CN383_07030 [Priestia megaterium]TCN10119.1 hypothetical protein EV581_105436 [Bacillus sp. BK006]